MFKGSSPKLPFMLWLVLAVIFIISFISLAVGLNVLGSVTSLEQGVIYDYNQPR